MIDRIILFCVDTWDLLFADGDGPSVLGEMPPP